MTDDAVKLKVKEALAATDNNRHDAQKLLITWAVRDPVLLLGITKPHLKAIATSLIEHALRAPILAPHDAGQDHLSRSVIDDIAGASIQRSPLEKRRKPNVPPPKSTERQASAMRKLAEAFSKKKEKE